MCTLFVGMFTFGFFPTVDCFFDKGGEIYRREGAYKWSQAVSCEISLSKELLNE